jgi:hypothetical protein
LTPNAILDLVPNILKLAVEKIYITKVSMKKTENFIKDPSMKGSAAE